MLFCISVSLPISVRHFQDGASDLSDLINYFEAKKQDIASDVEGKFYHMSSFDESTARSYINDPEKGPQFVKYNCRQMSRLYPGGIRQDSSNLNPLSGWNAGCQMGKLATTVLIRCYKYNVSFFFSCPELPDGGPTHFPKPRQI